MKQILLFFLLLLFTFSTTEAQGPPPGITPVYFCDDNSDGFLEFDLDYIISTYFDFGPDQEVTIHQTSADAVNGVNQLISPYLNITNPEYLWVRIFDIPSGTMPNLPGQLELNVIECDGDADSDSVDSSTEDLNGNGDLGDDDTDNDLLPNFMDDDDDDDGVLTINEDYNGNGDPTDDDINGNMIPDYLDSEATLGEPEAFLILSNIFPNPTKGLLHLSVRNAIPDQLDIALYALSGQKVSISILKREANLITINLNNVQDGLYFLSISDGKHKVLKKIVLKR